jgi:hypothetical protein
LRIGAAGRSLPELIQRVYSPQSANANERRTFLLRGGLSSGESSMQILLWVVSLLLIAEFVMAPINLWTGRTLSNFTRFTGLSPRIATSVFAPAKLLGAAFIGVGLFVPILSVAGACILGIISLVYLYYLCEPSRRDLGGIVMFALSLACAATVIWVNGESALHAVGLAPQFASANIPLSHAP